MVSDKTIYKALELFIKPYKNITIIFFTIHQNYALAILKRLLHCAFKFLFNFNFNWKKKVFVHSE